MNAELQREDVEAVLSYRHSARDLVLFLGLLLLDVKLNELLNIRRKDISPEMKNITLWGGPGQIEREIPLPEIMTPFFIARMNELSDGEYLFSSDRNVQKPVTGQGANKIIQRMFLNAGLECKINCRIMRQSGIEANDLLTADIVERFFKTEMHLFTRHKQPLESVGSLKVKVGELVRYKGIVSAGVEFRIRGLVGEYIKFRGVGISTLSYRGPSLSFPSYGKWENELLWVSREMKERICSSEFKDRISEIIAEKYLEKKKSCYIRNKRFNAYWKKTG